MMEGEVLLAPVLRDTLAKLVPFVLPLLLLPDLQFLAHHIV